MCGLGDGLVFVFFFIKLSNVLICVNVVLLLSVFRIWMFFVFLVIFNYERLLEVIFSCLRIVSFWLLRYDFLLLKGNLLFLGLNSDVVFLLGCISWLGNMRFLLVGDVGM